VLEKMQVSLHEMLHITDREHRQGWQCFVTLAILVVTCALAINVVTRYSSESGFSPSASRTVYKGSSLDTSKRLSKDAMKWIPPFVCSIALAAPVLYSRAMPAIPPIHKWVLAKGLYNRPPPIPQSSR
jgi:hypothetical protein